MGHRRNDTRRRSAVRDALCARVGYAAAHAVWVDLRGDEYAPSMATLYRALDRLVADGDVAMIHDLTGTRLYRARGEIDDRNLHIVCPHCGSIARHPLPDALRPEVVSTATGVDLCSPEFEVLGVCAACAA